MGFEIKTEEYTHGEEEIIYGYIPWDSSTFGNNIYEVRDIKTKENLPSDDLFTGFIQLMGQKNASLICAKVPASDIGLIDTLQKHGFGFIEETVRPVMNNLQMSKVDYARMSKFQLDRASRDDLAEIQRIARTTFEHDRFHRDRHFLSGLAGERYAQWVVNSFNDGEDVLCIRSGSGIIGFAIVSIQGESASLPLIGIDDRFKGTALGISLYAATCLYLKERKVKNVSTTISMNNLPVLNIYAICGFTFRDPTYVFHKWL